MRNERINMCHHFLRDVLEEKDINIKYIKSKEIPVDIITKTCSEADHAKHENRLTEGELWDIVETER